MTSDLIICMSIVYKVCMVAYIYCIPYHKEQNSIKPSKLRRIAHYMYNSITVSQLHIINIL